MFGIVNDLLSKCLLPVQPTAVGLVGKLGFQVRKNDLERIDNWPDLPMLRILCVNGQVNKPNCI